MSRLEVLDYLIKSFSHFYTVRTFGTLEPFEAEAEFHSVNSKYFVFKEAKLAEEELNEYVYFAIPEVLDNELITELEKLAWEDGLGKVKPHSSHRCSDISLVIIADKISDTAKEYIKGIVHSKIYKLSFFGWSTFRIIALELSSGELYYNRKGADLTHLFQKFTKHEV